MNIYEKINKNIIIGEIDITNKDINKNIRIINSFEQFKRENNRKNEEDDYKYENEKEIKEKCKIKIDNIIVPFNYFYKFNKIGRYIIEYIFTGNLNKTNYKADYEDCSLKEVQNCNIQRDPLDLIYQYCQ